MYHIEKGDYVNRYQHYENNPISAFIYKSLGILCISSIETCNITGQLIINDLTKSLTSTPILNVVQDTNQVDFGLFKGKHIRISQYTNIGYVVLDEWYVPGTPTPPEPEQPDWFKESIVAWYSPYCKQRMTNFDVIEAYTEDFTKWVYRNSRGTAKITNNTIVIANVVETNNIVEDDNEPYSDLTISVTGVTENKHLIVRQGRGKPETHIKKDGVYTFKDNNLYFGFGVSVIGECNITITQLPTSILKDFSGNGNHAYLYGGKGKLNSGMGVYKEDFTTWNYVPERGDVTRSYNTMHITKVTNTVTANIISKTNEFGNSITLKIVGATSDNPLMVGTYSKPNGYTAISKDGVYSFEIDEQYWGFRFNKDGDVNVTITQIPDYPDQLCYDGSMCAVVYEFPILTDYTIIADRTWFNIRDISCFIGKRNTSGDNLGAFEFEFRANRTFSFGGNNVIIFADNNIVYQTKNSYNGTEIKPGSLDDTDVLIIGAAQRNVNNKIQDPYIGCHGNILIFNRTLTEYELSWVKNNMMCSKQQEPDIDL